MAKVNPAAFKPLNSLIEAKHGNSENGGFFGLPPSLAEARFSGLSDGRARIDRPRRF
jgi:hypothetical protein